MLDVYGAFMTDVLAIPIVKGLKTARERFAGATNTLTCEAMMRDGKALQMGTSHELAIVLIVKDDPEVRGRAHQIVGELRDAGVRVVLDEHTDVSFGRRAIDAELKGIPVRVELGPRDVAAGKAVLVRRVPGTKEPVALTAVVPETKAALGADQQTLYNQALARREAASPYVESIDEALDAATRGWARIPWSVLGEQGEAQLTEHAVTVRCLTRPDGSLPASGDEPDLIAWIGRSY